MTDYAENITESILREGGRSPLILGAALLHTQTWATRLAKARSEATKVHGLFHLGELMWGPGLEDASLVHETLVEKEKLYNDLLDRAQQSCWN